MAGQPPFAVHISLIVNPESVYGDLAERLLIDFNIEHFIDVGWISQPYGMSRFIARLGPVPLQSHHGNGFCYVARPSSGLHDPSVSLHARMAPLPLCGSRRSETPGARQSLSFAWTDAWLARRSIRSAGPQSLPFSGLWVRCRASPLHLAERPLPKQRFREVGSTLARKASVLRRSLAYVPSQ